ncbi:MAG: hypothetical protein AAF690_15385 [Acidobacteriota bacterium]
MTEEAKQPHERRDETTGPLDPPLPTWVRALLFALGSLLVLVGLVALALPVVPQALPLAAGAALLSLASDRLYLFLRTRLRRWPWLWRPLRSFRIQVHRLLSRLSGASRSDKD